MTHRNWTLFSTWLIEIEPFFFERDPVWKNDSKNWTLLFFFFNNDSKDWTLCKWLIQLSIFYEPLLNKSWTFVFIWLKNWTFFQYDSKDFEYFTKIWTLFTTQRIDSFLIRLKKLKFLVDKKLNSFQRIRTQRIELLFSKKWCKVFFYKKTWFEEWNLIENMTHRIEFFKQICDSKNWTFLTLTQLWTLQMWLKELNFFLFSISQRIGVFLVWLIENYAKNCSFNSKSWIFLDMSQRIQVFFLNTTQRVAPFFWIRRKELNPFVFEYDAKNWILCLWKRRKELNPFVFELDSKNRTLFLMRLKKLNFFGWKIVKTLNSFQKIMTQRIEFFSKWCKECIFEKKIWFEEWNFLENITFKQKHDSKNWTLFTLTRRTDFFKTQRIELFFKYGAKNWTFFV